MLSHKFIWKNPYAFSDWVAQVLTTPHISEALYWVNFFFYLSYMHHELWERYSSLGKQPSCLRGFPDKSQNRLTIVLRNIFSVISNSRVMTDFIFNLMRPWFIVSYLRPQHFLALNHLTVDWINLFIFEDAERFLRSTRGLIQ